MISLEAIVSGQVQGVRYRVFVQDVATELELVGSVQNMPDGTVRVIAEGSPDILKDFVEYLNEGSLQSNVESVAVEWGTATRSLAEYSMLE